jgi:hypothetical protein
VGRFGAFWVEGAVNDHYSEGGLSALLPDDLRWGGTASGLRGGLELDWTPRERDALWASGDLYLLPGDRTGLFVGSAGWMHGWQRFQLSLGLYSLIDLPDRILLEGEPPVGPLLNGAWVFGGSQE